MAPGKQTFLCWGTMSLQVFIFQILYAWFGKNYLIKFSSAFILNYNTFQVHFSGVLLKHLTQVFYVQFVL